MVGVGLLLGTVTSVVLSCGWTLFFGLVIACLGGNSKNEGHHVAMSTFGVGLAGAGALGYWMGDGGFILSLLAGIFITCKYS